MAATSNSVLIASSGTVSLTPNVPVTFTTTWGANISPFRWTRIWTGVLPASDQASFQSVAIESEGTQWSSGAPATTAHAATIRGQSNFANVPVVARLQFLASQADTF